MNGKLKVSGRECDDDDDDDNEKKNTCIYTPVHLTNNNNDFWYVHIWEKRQPMQPTTEPAPLKQMEKIILMKICMHVANNNQIESIEAEIERYIPCKQHTHQKKGIGKAPTFPISQF